MTAGGRERRAIGAAELRREFDLGFSQASDLERAPVENLLVVQLGSREFAVRTRDLRAIVRTPRIACVPSPIPALLGIGGIRGEILPVFDLARLLGVSEEAEGLRWSLLAGDSEQTALAFRHLERFERVPTTAVARAETDALRVPGVEEIVRLKSGVLPIIGVERLIAGLLTST